MNSTWRTISFDQVGTSLSREFMMEGLKNENVQHYFSLMKNAAVLFGANPERAEKEMMDTLNFEIKLANASMPRELRRNAFALYRPMTLEDLGFMVPWLNFTEYTNRVLTKEIAQVRKYLKGGTLSGDNGPLKKCCPLDIIPLIF